MILKIIEQIKNEPKSEISMSNNSKNDYSKSMIS